MILCMIILRISKMYPTHRDKIEVDPKEEEK
jgi:hypothetical protein